MNQPTTRMELKYCERCGGLWLRPQAEPAACCRPCTLELERASAQLAPRRLPRGRRPLASASPQNTDTDTGRTA